MTENPNKKQSQEDQSSFEGNDLLQDEILDGNARISNLWERISQLGIAEPVLRVGTLVLTIILVAITAMAMRSFSATIQDTREDDIEATAEAIAVPTMAAAVGEVEGLGAQLPAGVMPEYLFPSSFSGGISRQANLETIIPSRPRVGTTTYEVELGDNLFSIAELFGLRPETVLWGNYEVLEDNPRYISVGQVLTILPIDGVYHKWSAGENLYAVANYFGVEADAIISWPGNNFDPYETDPDTAEIADGTWLIVPGGERALQDWGPPRISRSNPAVAAYYGEGACGAVYEGAVGTNTFIWPTTSRLISGYGYDPVIHPGLDIGGNEGNAVYATDTGVVVYAGWSQYGYGNMIVIDHGTGWQSAYAHLSTYNVYCGQSVYQGDLIGAIGNTGNSSGAHLHFELNSEIFGKVNPFDYTQ